MDKIKSFMNGISPQINNAVQIINNAVNAGQTPQQIRKLLQNPKLDLTGVIVEAAICKVGKTNPDFAKKFIKMMNPNARVSS